LLADPVVTGLVQSMARPGGNITGLTQQASDLGGKRLDLLREIVPGLAHVAVMFNSDNPSTVSELHEVRAAARSLGVEIATIDVRRGADIAPAIELINGKAEALYVLTDPIMIVNQVQINSLALDARLPTLHGVRTYVESGGLISYGASFSDLFRRAGDYVDRILRGTKPAEMPIEQPTKFELVINLKTAKSLGLSVPPILITSADELIE
jgi:putative tryptophan/tyrosine transport system substrate-binding protein